MTQTSSIFNTPFETGVRSSIILLSLHPKAFDLHALVEIDYLVLHSADIGGPSSLHAPLPYRSGELLIKRGIVESGLKMFMTKGLVESVLTGDGFNYRATENTFSFVDSLNSSYLKKLKERASWLAELINNGGLDEVKSLTQSAVKDWGNQFQIREQG